MNTGLNNKVKVLKGNVGEWGNRHGVGVLHRVG